MRCQLRLLLGNALDLGILERTMVASLRQRGMAVWWPGWCSGDVRAHDVRRKAMDDAELMEKKRRGGEDERGRGCHR